METDYYVHPTAEVSSRASIGKGTKIWNQAQIREGATLGEYCIVGKDVYIDKDVLVGHRVKIQNAVSIYCGVTIEDDVFVGPHATFTNDKFPRADNAAWSIVPTLVKRGASIGANATIICGVTIGERAMIGAGAVVTKDVPADAVVVGNPARPIQRGELSPHTPLPIMLIGYGAMGKNYARVLASLTEHFKLKVIVDISFDRIEEAQRQHPTVNVTNDYLSYIEDVTAVIIAVPVKAHYQLTRDMLIQGKHCLLEKPCCGDSETAADLFKRAVSVGLTLQVGHIERFNPAVEALVGYLQSEQILSIDAQRWGLSNRTIDTDVVLDVMTHDLELAAAILGQEPVQVYAQRFGSEASLEAASAIVLYSGGAHATFSASRITPTRRRVFYVTTTNAHYELDLAQRTLRRFVKGGSGKAEVAQNTVFEFSGPDPLTRQLLSFASSVKEQADVRVKDSSVLSALKLAETIRQLVGTQT